MIRRRRLWSMSYLCHCKRPLDLYCPNGHALCCHGFVQVTESWHNSAGKKKSRLLDRVMSSTSWRGGAHGTAGWRRCRRGRRRQVVDDVAVEVIDHRSRSLLTDDTVAVRIRVSFLAAQRRWVRHLLREYLSVRPSVWCLTALPVCLSDWWSTPKWFKVSKYALCHAMKWCPRFLECKFRNTDFRGSSKRVH